jgi:hypothetical protein
MIIGRILPISLTITEKHKKLNKEEREHRTVMAKYAGRFLIKTRQIGSLFWRTERNLSNSSFDDSVRIARMIAGNPHTGKYVKVYDTVTYKTVYRNRVCRDSISHWWGWDSNFMEFELWS